MWNDLQQTFACLLGVNMEEAHEGASLFGHDEVKGAVPVYRAEASYGLSRAIAKNVARASCPILNSRKIDIVCGSDDSLPVSDLFSFDSILVSVAWNKNDDVFDPDEVWAGRFTPIDKPFNLEHRPREIIGHTVDSYPVDDDQARLENIPAKPFHLLASSVIYRHLASRDNKLEDEIGRLIAEIQAGEWAVSMECLFEDFHYALRNEGEDYEIVERGENTAFLTKHLRVYGGVGTYQGRAIGRVLRGITFSAVGLTKKPANVGSVILAA